MVEAVLAPAQTDARDKKGFARSQWKLLLFFAGVKSLLLQMELLSNWELGVSQKILRLCGTALIIFFRRFV